MILKISSEKELVIRLKEKELVICKDYFLQRDKYCLAYKVFVSCNIPFIRNNYYIDVITGKLLANESVVCASNASGSAETMYSGTKSVITDSYNSQYRLREIRNGVSIETYNLNHYLEWQTNLATDIYDNNNTWTLAERPVEKYAHDAHWATEKVFDYWLQVHGRNSLDGNGMAIKSYIQYGNNFSGGAWFGNNGYPILGYGEGNACYKPGSSLDNVAHETGHAICQYTSNLFPGGTPGAINESLSDIWGAVIENWAAPNSPPKDKWKIGEEFTITSPGYIRNMANPTITNDNAYCGFYKQPDTYNGPLWIDGADVHKNSGVMNYWFYLLSDGSGGNKTNAVGNVYNVTGIGITKAANITYQMEKNPVSLYANLFEVRQVSIWKARKLYGGGCKGSAEEIAVTKAWYAVNVGSDYNSNPPYTLDGDVSACNQYQCNTYSLTGVPPDATINWILTQTPNNTVSGVNNGNGTYAICRNNNTNGFVTITAQIVFGQCTTAVSKSINVGMPYVLFPYQGTTYPIALMYDINNENCNTTCYSPSQYSFYSVSDAYNGTVSWQKLSSYPANVAWSGYNNYVKVLLKAPNQTITLKRIITNPCNTGNPIEEVYCFMAGNTLCTSLKQTSIPPIAQQLKVYPNPASVNNTLTLELTSEKGDVIDFENSSIQLVDAQNVVIAQKSGNKIAIEKLEIPALSNGVYYIKVINKNGVSSQQLIIKN